MGVARTGRIITAAALLMSISFAALTSADVSFMRMFGVGLTLAVLIDATLVRVLLVPAFMHVFGRLNWWAPAPLARLRRGRTSGRRTHRARPTRSGERAEWNVSRSEALDGDVVHPSNPPAVGRRLRFVSATHDDPLARPLLAELADEYAQRYGGTPSTHLSWLPVPASELAAPDGGLLIGVLDGVPVTGGAFRRYDAETAELKRIWTDRAHRRRGYARRCWRPWRPRPPRADTGAST